MRKSDQKSGKSDIPQTGRKGALPREDVTFFHDLALAAEQAMSADAEKAMRVFAGL